jgi:hypothetical protein
MTDELEQVTAEQELTEIMSGYDTSRSDPLPEEGTTEEFTVTNEEPEQTPEPTQELTVADLSAELKALKEKVASSHGDADSVRKLHGEIGNINRTLLEMKAPPPAPVVDTDAAELDALIEEYPDLVGPLVKTLRATQAQLASLQRPPEDIDNRVAEKIAALRKEEAAETLAIEHPDYRTLPGTPEYENWLSSKTPEFQERFRTTWNPAVVSRGLTEFKESLKKREEKQERLASAITPKGVSRKVGESTLSDEEAIWAGYNSGPKRQIK